MDAAVYFTAWNGSAKGRFLNISLPVGVRPQISVTADVIHRVHFFFNSTVSDNSSDDCAQLYGFEDELFGAILLGAIAMPVILLGLIANVVSLVVFIHPLMRRSMFNWYLAALTVSDAIILLSDVVNFLIPNVARLLQSRIMLALR